VPVEIAQGADQAVAAYWQIVQGLGLAAAKERSPRNELVRTVEHVLTLTADDRSWRRSVLAASW